MQETPQITVSLLPERISQLAEQHQLGQLQMLYHRRLHRFLLWLLPWWVVLAVIILGTDGYRLFLDYSAPISPNAVSPLAGTGVSAWADTAQLVFTIGLIVLSALGVHPFWGGKKRLYLMDNGLVYTNGRKAETVRWDEIDAIYWWKKRGISYLRCKNDPRFSVIEEMEKAREISTIVAGAVVEQLLPGTLAQYRKTGNVRFGPLSVTWEGIANASKVASWEAVPVIAWAEIDDVSFAKGHLGIRVGGKWKYWDKGIMEAYTIPNPTLCVALVRHILETVSKRKSEAIS